MRKLLLVLLCAMMSMGVSAQQKIKSDHLDRINSISLSGKLTVEYIPSDSNHIEIDLFNSDIKKLRWSLSDGNLDVQLRPSPEAYANVKIWSKTGDLQNISISESDLICNTEIATPMLELSMLSSAKATLNLKCLDLDITVASNSVLSASGEVKYLQLRSSEKARVDVRKIEATSVDVDASTGAEVYVSVIERLQAYPKTSATVFYIGDPTILKIKTSKIAGMGAGVHKIK